MTQPFIPAVNTVQCNLVYVQQGELAENVLYFQGAGPWTHQNITDLCGALAAWENTQMKGVRHNQTALNKIVARDLSSENAESIEYMAGLPITGSNAGAPLPNNVTIAVAHRTGKAGRSFRGRTYHIGLPSSLITGNFLLGTQVANFITLYGGLLNAAAFTMNSAQLAVVSRRHNNAWRAQALVTPVTGITVEQTLDSMRRRLPGHNRHR